jgi:O-antigen/teichoic acid export membrane protein
MSSGFKGKVLKGAFWMTLSTWLVSSLGIVSTLILARILTPEDFGLIATATIITGFFELFAKLGTMQYILNKKNPTSDDINTAWTIQLLSQIIIACLIILVSSYAATYFNEPRIELVLIALAIIPPLIGLKNVGLVLLQKKMEFKRIMFMQSTAKIISFGVLITVAYLYQSYWAFIFGMVIQHLCAFILSYVISSYRPRLCLLKVKEQFSFSSWIILKGFVNYAGNKADAFLISKYLSIANIGFFNLGTRIAAIPNDYLLKPLDNVIYSGLADSLSHKALFHERCQKTLNFVIFISIPICAIPILSAQEIVHIFLGDIEKWSTVAKILPYLSLQIVLLPLWSRLYDFITLIGEVKRIFILDLIYALISISILIIAINNDAGLVQIIAISLIMRMVFISYLILICRRLVNLQISRLAFFTLPVLSSALVSGWLTIQFNSLVTIEHSFVNLFVTSSVFTLIYTILICIFVFLLKRINNDYQMIIELMQSLLHNKKAKKSLF